MSTTKKQPDVNQEAVQQCNCCNLNKKPATVREVEKLVKPIQAAWTARWNAIDKVTSKLKEYGFQDGVGVWGDYFKYDKFPYEVAWVVSEHVHYLVTGGRHKDGCSLPVCVERVTCLPLHCLKFATLQPPCTPPSGLAHSCHVL